MKHITRLTVQLCAVSVLVACVTNPVTGRRQLMLVPEGQAISASKDAYTQMLNPIKAEGKLDSDPKVTQRVVKITERLVAQAIKFRPETENWEWSVHVIDDPETVNAWCMAGGKMAVYTGLLEKINTTDDELAQVMGHEIAHALSNHTAERMSMAMASQAAVAAAGVYAASRNQNVQATLAGASLAAAVALQLPNSRESEAESDRIGIELAAKAGYDPQAAVTLWQKMAEESGSKSKFDWLSTHPAPAKRMETLAELVPQMKPYYEAADNPPVHALRTSGAP